MIPAKTTVPMFWLLCLAVFVFGQAKPSDQPNVMVTKIKGDVPASDARIVKFYINDAPPNTGYETGALHILYSDKTEVVEKLPPKKKSTAGNIVFNQVGIAEPKLADDLRSIAWVEQVENCCTSYSIPLALAVYRSGKKIVHIQEGQMLWKWAFLDGGKLVATAWGPVHGSDIGDYQLLDAETGHLIDEVVQSKEVAVDGGVAHRLDPSAPAWAKKLEEFP